MKVRIPHSCEVTKSGAKCGILKPHTAGASAILVATMGTILFIVLNLESINVQQKLLGVPGYLYREVDPVYNTKAASCSLPIGEISEV